jgi:hypothetical protein
VPIQCQEKPGPGARSHARLLLTVSKIDSSPGACGISRFAEVDHLWREAEASCRHGDVNDADGKPEASHSFGERVEVPPDEGAEGEPGEWEAAEKNFGQSPIPPDKLSQLLAELLDANAVIVCENTTALYKPFAFGLRDEEQMLIGTAGASLGWGVGAATGAKLGAPDRHPQQLQPALDRRRVMTGEGKLYLIEVATARRGPGAESAWYRKVERRNLAPEKQADDRRSHEQR